MSITINPNLTTGAKNTFVKDTAGLIQGTTQPDPSARLWIEGGLIDSTQGIALWGGAPITIKVPVSGKAASGQLVKTATTGAGIQGWTVFDQSAALFVTPSSNVPTGSGGGNINFVRFGTNIRIALPIDPAIVGTIEGGLENAQVSWDFTNRRIAAYDSSFALPIAILAIYENSEIVAWDGTNATWATGPCALVRI